MVLSLITWDHILNLILISIWIHAYLLLHIVYPILLNKIYIHLNLMVATQLLMYLINHIYLLHLDILIYFTTDNHNGDLFLRHILLQPSCNIT